jgi:predicted SAM-dependent methyltransferase
MEAARIIIGAGNTQQDGWRSLNHSDLDITDGQQWARLFQPASLDAILAEHVFEHLTTDEAQRAARFCHYFLKRGGHLRLAVPDGFHPSPNYINWTAPYSPGERFLQNFRHPQDKGHQVLWNCQTLSNLLRAVGFRVRLLEWFDERGIFNKREWRPEHGDISRCHGALHSDLLGIIVGAPYTSLIADAIKQ